MVALCESVIASVVLSMYALLPHIRAGTGALPLHQTRPDQKQPLVVFRPRRGNPPWLPSVCGCPLFLSWLPHIRGQAQGPAHTVQDAQDLPDTFASAAAFRPSKPHFKPAQTHKPKHQRLLSLTKIIGVVIAVNILMIIEVQKLEIC